MSTQSWVFFVGTLLVVALALLAVAQGWLRKPTEPAHYHEGDVDEVPAYVRREQEENEQMFADIAQYLRGERWNGNERDDVQPV